MLLNYYAIDCVIVDMMVEYRSQSENGIRDRTLDLY